MRIGSIVLIPMLLFAQGPQNRAGQAAPELKAPVVKPHSATLSWTQASVPAGSCDVSSNSVYRGTKAGGETLLSTTGGPATTFTDTTVAAGTTYYYQISAVNCAGESPRSNEVHATIPHKPH